MVIQRLANVMLNRGHGGNISLIPQLLYGYRLPILYALTNLRRQKLGSFLIYKYQK